MAENVKHTPKATLIADAIEACDWSGSPIGNKEILRAAVIELRSLQAWQNGAISCREAEEARIEAYKEAAGATDNRHEFVPNRKYPWFCAHCGYAPHEPLKHFQPEVSA